MKCPKCQYLGFDTGDRCRNCGYDFSLVPPAPSTPAREFLVEDVLLHHQAGSAAVVDHVADVPLAPSSSPRRAARVSSPSALPLFAADPTDDAPLVRLARAPRPPVAVRKTPEIPRIKVVPPPRRREPREETPQLDLAPPAPPQTTTHRPRRADPWQGAPACAMSARLSALAVDLGILFAIDLAVLYFTLRIAALTPGEWRLVPPVPFVLFLLLLKVLYYWAFTTIGGQTIGKMAMRIRVVADGEAAVAPARAFSRTVTATASLLTLGVPFIAGLFGSDRRLVHDRLARTRVVTLPGA